MPAPPPSVSKDREKALTHLRLPFPTHRANDDCPKQLVYSDSPCSSQSAIHLFNSSIQYACIADQNCYPRTHGQKLCQLEYDAYVQLLSPFPYKLYPLSKFLISAPFPPPTSTKLFHSFVAQLDTLVIVFIPSWVHDLPKDLFSNLRT